MHVLFGNPKRRKDHHLDDSPYSDSLNRIDIRSSYRLVMIGTGMVILEQTTDPIFSHLNLSFVTIISLAFSISSSSLPAFF